MFSYQVDLVTNLFDVRIYINVCSKIIKGNAIVILSCFLSPLDLKALFATGQKIWDIVVYRTYYTYPCVCARLLLFAACFFRPTSARSHARAWTRMDQVKVSLRLIWGQETKVTSFTEIYMLVNPYSLITFVLGKKKKFSFLSELPFLIWELSHTVFLPCQGHVRVQVIFL